MRKNSDYSYWIEAQEPDDELDDMRGFILNAPKRDAIRRKGRFREKEFAPELNAGNRKKYNRRSIRTDVRFWEE